MPKISSVTKKLQNLVHVQKKFQPSFCAHEDQLQNWHHVDRNCYDVLALMRKIESLQKLCWDYDLFSHSDRTLGWMNSRGPHRLHQEPFDTPPRLRIATNGPIFEAQKICTVVVCTHSSVRNCPSTAQLVQACSRQPPEPERFPRLGNHDDLTFGPPHPSSSVWQVIQVGRFEAAMFCSAPLCCHVVSPRHTTLLLPVWNPKVGLGKRWWLRKKLRQWKCKAEKPSYLVFRTFLWENPNSRIRLSVFVTKRPHLANALSIG